MNVIFKNIKHEKEFKSFKKRLGKHQFWFESLNPRKQKDIFFSWKKYKYSTKELIKDRKIFSNIRKRRRNRLYSPQSVSFRKFIYRIKPHYRVSRTALRDTKITKILDTII